MKTAPYIAQIDDYRGVPQDPNKVLITNPDLQSAHYAGTAG